MSRSVQPECLLCAGGVTTDLTEVIGLVGYVLPLHVFNHMGTILAVIRTVGAIPHGFSLVHFGVDFIFDS